MPESEGTEVEYKTIRVSAATYYKISEIAGFWAIFTGQAPSISGTTEMIVEAAYSEWYPKFVKMVSDPSEMKRAKEQAQKWIAEFTQAIQSPVQPAKR